jgi:hypothetical protein
VRLRQPMCGRSLTFQKTISLCLGSAPKEIWAQTKLQFDNFGRSETFLTADGKAAADMVVWFLKLDSLH